MSLSCCDQKEHRLRLYVQKCSSRSLVAICFGNSLFPGAKKEAERIFKNHPPEPMSIHSFSQSVHCSFNQKYYLSMCTMCQAFSASGKDSFFLLSLFAKQSHFLPWTMDPTVIISHLHNFQGGHRVCFLSGSGWAVSLSTLAP